MTAEHYRNVVLRHWRLIIFCSLLLGAGAGVGSLLVTPVYQSTVTLQLVIASPDAALLEQTTTDPVTLSFQTRTDRMVQTEVNLATSDSILTQVAARYPGLSVAQLKGEVVALTVPNTQLLRITVSDRDPARAAHLANDLAAALIAQQARDTQQFNAQAEQPLRDALAETRQKIDTDKARLKSLQSDPSANQQEIQRLQDELDSLQQRYEQEQQSLANIQSLEARTYSYLQVVNAAQPGSTPVHANLWLIEIAAGLGFGLLLGVSLALLRDRLDQPIRAVSALSELSGWPVLEEVDRPALDKEHQTGNDEDQGADRLSAYQKLSQNLAFFGIETPLSAIAVTSAPADAEVANVVAGDLALLLARSGKRVVLVDANFSEPTQHRRFGTPDAPGLGAAALAFAEAGQKESGEAQPPLAPYLYQVREAGASLRVLPAGPPPPNPAQVLKSPAMRAIFRSFGEGEADVVVLAGPPITSSMDSGALAALADGVLVAIDLAHARKRKLARMKRLLDDVGARVLGSVVCREPLGQAKQPEQQGIAAGASIS